MEDKPHRAPRDGYKGAARLAAPTSVITTATTKVSTAEVATAEITAAEVIATTTAVSAAVVVTFVAAVVGVGLVAAVHAASAGGVAAAPRATPVEERIVQPHAGGRAEQAPQEGAEESTTTGTATHATASGHRHEQGPDDPDAQQDSQADPDPAHPAVVPTPQGALAILVAAVVSRGAFATEVAPHPVAHERGALEQGTVGVLLVEPGL